MSNQSSITTMAPTFSADLPSDQNALDLFRDGWTSAMPDKSGLVAGHNTGHFNDARVTWAADILGGMAGKSVLELGPYEGYNTYQLEQLGASVTAIEASDTNFVKCLIVKNIFSLAAKTLLGDFVLYAETTRKRFDVCWASGILYHMTDPLRLLRGLARVSDTLFIWTQYHDAEVIAANAAQAAYFDVAQNREEMVEGRAITLNFRSYQQLNRAYFSGGHETFSYWISKEDIFWVLRTLGFTDIRMGVDAPGFPAGPACFFLAHRA